jgi:hypothetical protein
VVLNDIFKFEQKGKTDKEQVLGEWVMNRRRPSFMHKLDKRMVKLPEGFFEE